MADVPGGDEDAPAPVMPRHDRAAIVWQARCLLRAATAGTLATAEDGQPYAALITPAAAPDLSLLMLLSGLSAHTRHLQEDGRCALMVMGPPTDTNPQTAPRLTVLGVAAREDDPALKARWVARHPYAAFYADLGDFRLVRLRPTGGHFVGGFASAHRLSAADLTPDPAAVAAIAEAEPGILEQANTRYAAVLNALGGGPECRLIAADVDGCDVASGELVRRVAWPAPVADVDGVWAALKQMSAA